MASLESISITVGKQIIVEQVTELSIVLRLELALVFPEEEGMMQQSSVSISLSF